MTIALNYEQLEARLIWLKPLEHGCRVKLAQLRRLMDDACDQQAITIQQWRSLLERISIVQGRLVHFEPDGWRRPPILS